MGVSARVKSLRNLESGDVANIGGEISEVSLGLLVLLVGEPWHEVVINSLDTCAKADRDTTATMTVVMDEKELLLVFKSSLATSKAERSSTWS